MRDIKRKREFVAVRAGILYRGIDDLKSRNRGGEEEGDDSDKTETRRKGDRTKSRIKIGIKRYYPPA